MSVFTDWESAKNLISSGNNLEYPQAIDYYNNLKERLFQQIMIKNNLSDISTSQIGKILTEELENSVNILQKNIFNLSQESLQTIQKWVVDKFNSDEGQELSLLTSQIKDLKNDIEKNKTQKTKEIEALQLQIKQMFNSEKELLILANQALNTYASTNIADYNSVLSFLSTFLVNMVQWIAEQGAQKVFINANAKTTLMGYYKEIIEKKLLQEIFTSTKLDFPKVELVGGKNTINDLLLPFDGLNRTFSTSEMINLLNEKDETILISMGAQVKARNIKNIGSNFMKISHQAYLRDLFNVQMKNNNQNGFNNYSWACGAVFLGQMNNIIQSFGNNNVIFISGSSRMFMDDFIKTFRKENMYLTFELDKNHQATSQVGLQRFIENRKKQQLLRRFR